MFLMFSLHRPDILPVGDLGVQKGLLRWALAAHGALPRVKGGKSAKEARKKYGLGEKDAVVEDMVTVDGSGELDTVVTDRTSKETTPVKDSKDIFPPTPHTPSTEFAHQPITHTAALHTPASNGLKAPMLPPTPQSPSNIDLKPREVFEAPAKVLPPPAPETFIHPPSHHANWDAHAVAPLPEGLTVEGMKSRLNGKKAKGGAYLTPAEMDTLTSSWRPYRSLGVYYMWPAGEDM